MANKHISDETRLSIVQFFLQNHDHGRVKRSKVIEAAAKWGMSRRTLNRIWQKARGQIAAGLPAHVKSQIPGKSGRPIKVMDPEAVMSVPLRQRATIRELTKRLVIGKSTVGKWAQKGQLKAHTNAIKPELTAGNKLHRLHFSVSKLFHNEFHNQFQFQDMHHIVHIDEKWFHLSRPSQRYYLLPGESEPHRTCKSKKFIPKIMFVCAVSRPIFGHNGEVLFDGKIGIFPLTYTEPAKRKSKNRAKGTMITKPIQSITKEVVKSCLIEKIIPALKQVWPSQASKVILIQQDNARPHICDEDEDFRNIASSDGFDITLTFQPPNSPDLNVLDLGFFRAIQSLQNENTCYNLEELVAAVQDAYAQLDACTLNKVFLSLQSCMVEIMQKHGDNNYQLPHMKKNSLERLGILPTDLFVDRKVVKDALQVLSENRHLYGLEGMVEAIQRNEEPNVLRNSMMDDID